MYSRRHVSSSYLLLSDVPCPFNFPLRMRGPKECATPQDKRDHLVKIAWIINSRNASGDLGMRWNQSNKIKFSQRTSQLLALVSISWYPKSEEEKENPSKQRLEVESY